MSIIRRLGNLAKGTLSTATSAALRCSSDGESGATWRRHAQAVPATPNQHPDATGRLERALRTAAAEA